VGQVSFTLVDNSTDQTATVDNGYQGSGLSAEWIVEAPSTEDGSGDVSVTTLADYGSTVFDHLALDQSRGSVDLTTNDEILMLQNDAITSYPSAPSSDGDAFSIAYGSMQPSPPDDDAPAVVASGPEQEGQFRFSTPDEFSLLPGRFVSP